VGPVRIMKQGTFKNPPHYTGISPYIRALSTFIPIPARFRYQSRPPPEPLLRRVISNSHTVAAAQGGALKTFASTCLLSKLMLSNPAKGQELEWLIEDKIPST
jgi:hypothetical protein